MARTGKSVRLFAEGEEIELSRSDAYALEEKQVGSAANGNAKKTGASPKRPKKSFQVTPGHRSYSKTPTQIPILPGPTESITTDYWTRRPRRKSRRCLGLSAFSWLFLTLAFFQAVIVIGLQITIAIKGDFRETHLDQYVGCLEDGLNITINETDPFPSFGRDKEIYIYFFVFLVLYNFALVLYALIAENIVEVYMFMMINILAMLYAFLQVYQFRGFGEGCEIITLVGWLAFGNAGVLMGFTVVFGLLSFFIYVEFGWKIYTKLSCNPELRYYYRVYEFFMSGLKVAILFTVIFSVGQCVLILQGNYEFYLTILLAIGAILFYFLAYFIVHRESIIGSIVLIITGTLMIAYFVFKIVRYSTRSCPLCQEQVDEQQESRDEIVDQLRANGLNRTNLEFLDRLQQFENLIMIGAVNFITTVIVIVFYFHLMRQFGKGLKEYFLTQPSLYSWCTRQPWCGCIRQPTSPEGTSLEVDGHVSEPKGRILRLWVSSRRKKKRKSKSSQRRESSIEEVISPIHPMFNTAPPTNMDHNGHL